MRPPWFRGLRRPRPRLGPPESGSPGREIDLREFEGLLPRFSRVSAASSRSSGRLAEATYLCDTVKPAMDKLRAAVDAAEAEMDAALYPYPTYEALVYSHHF